MIIEEEKVEIIDNEDTSNINNTIFEQSKEKSSLFTKTWFIITTIVLASILFIILIFFGIFTIYNQTHSITIAKGVYINGIDVSNLDKESAKERLKNYYQEQFSNDISLIHNNYITYIKTSEIEMNIDIDSAVNEAFKIGKTGNIFKDDVKVLGTMIKKQNVNVPVTFNEDTLKTILTNLSPELPDAVVQSGYYIDGNDLIITKGKNGYIIDIDSTFESLKQNIVNLGFVNNNTEIIAIEKSPEKINLDSIYAEIHKDAKDAYFTENPHVVYPSETGIDFSISLEEAKQKLENSDLEVIIPLKVLQPNIKTNDLPQEAFPDLLGKFSTKYPASNTNRTTNLRLAAQKIDGFVLLPGETFSYNNVVRRKNNICGI